VIDHDHRQRTARRQARFPVQVRGWVGSADITDDSRFGHIDMASAVRSPGSVLKHRQRTARRQARFPVQRQILKLPLESGIEGRHHLFIVTTLDAGLQRQLEDLALNWKSRLPPRSSLAMVVVSSPLLASARRAKSGASCGIWRGNSHTGSSIASFTAPDAAAGAALRSSGAGEQWR
jgi:hypothetical protein